MRGIYEVLSCEGIIGNGKAVKLLRKGSEIQMHGALLFSGYRK